MCSFCELVLKTFWPTDERQSEISIIEERLAEAANNHARIGLMEQFLYSRLLSNKPDSLVSEAIAKIYLNNGIIRINDLAERLCISQDAFEKRFRKVVGTTAKKFASIIRFNTILNNLNGTKTLTEICYENNFFDQAHFIKDFKQFTGSTPENFRRFL